MKKEYPEYAKGDVIKIEESLTKHNKKILEDYLSICGTTAGAAKVDKIKRVILQFYDITEVDLDKITKENVINYLLILNQSNRKGWTKHEAKVYVKKFLKWFTKDVDLFDIIKTSSKDKQTNVKESNLFSEEEIESMIEQCDSLKKKALITILFESGCRPQEVLNLRWSDIKFNDKYVEINFFSSKTNKSRTFPLIKAREFLWFYKQESRNKNSDLLFPSPLDKNKPITTTASNKMLRAIAKKANIQKDIWNYVLRHSRLTKLYEELPQPIVEKLVGHKDMAAVYAHISNKKANQELINKIYHVEDLPQDQKDKMQREILELKKKDKEKEIELEEIRQQLKEFLLHAKIGKIRS